MVNLKIFLSTWLCLTRCHKVNVTGSAKRGYPGSTYLETRNLTCEFGTTLKLSPYVLLT